MKMGHYSATVCVETTHETSRCPQYWIEQTASILPRMKKPTTRDWLSRPKVSRQMRRVPLAAVGAAPEINTSCHRIVAPVAYIASPFALMRLAQCHLAAASRRGDRRILPQGKPDSSLRSEWHSRRVHTPP